MTTAPALLRRYLDAMCPDAHAARKLTETMTDAVYQRAAKELLNNIDWSGGGGERVLAVLDIEADEFKPNSRATKALLKNWALNRVQDAYDEIDWRLRQGSMPIFRMITAPPDWKPEGHPGIYWSWDEHAAEAHWGRFDQGHVKWLLTATVTTTMIDWVATLAANADFDSEDEREIRLRAKVPIEFTYRPVK